MNMQPIRVEDRLFFAITRHAVAPAQDLGRWFCTKYRTQAEQSGVQSAARNMRKQGVPVDLAVRVLARRMS